MKMQIAIDEQIAKSNGINPKKIYEEIDSIFNFISATKEILPDGTLEYTNNLKAPKNELSDMSIAYVRLSEKQDFAKTCKKWLWLENMDDNNLQFDIDDVLEHLQKNNILFAR